ncbi:MAG: hypothetical protein HY692_06680, partial [Cyanobacteria bacterium NC_groundwater_1444_Ag_S-0.65um_54_12]|nr:hypothetical protein [Cyanobacteria bacterium NC_groundwater_1444_Ag_S-0.65um_54_12]
YLTTMNTSATELRKITPAGDYSLLFKKQRSGSDALNYPGNLVTTPEGKVIIADAVKQWIGLFDPEATYSANPYLNFLFFENWTNPRLLFDVYTNASESSSCDDIALDDTPGNPNFYCADLKQHAIWQIADVLTATANVTLEATPSKGIPYAGKPGKTSLTDNDSVVPLPSVEEVKFNEPTNVTFQRHNGTPYLYVADSGDHLILEINLATRQVRRVIGEVPPEANGKVRKALCYSASEEGADPKKAHLRFPHKALFDSQQRLVFADTENRLIRIADIYSVSPRIYTIAGIMLPDDEACGTATLPPAYTLEDGEARSSILNEAYSMALDPEGNLIIGDARANRLRKLWLSYLK